MKDFIEWIFFMLFILLMVFLIRSGCNDDQETKRKGLKGVFEDIWYGDTTAVDSGGE